MSYTLIDNDTGKDIVETLNNQKEEIERLENIIKEVREYIEENTESYYTNIEETNEEFELTCDPKELLEILDKEVN